MKLKDFIDYVTEAKSKGTLKSYKIGLQKFIDWYEKDGDTILKERFEDLQSTDQQKRKRFNREIEKFHRHLKNSGHAQNSAVSYVGGIVQLFRYFDMDIKNLPVEVTRKTTTVKDFVPSVQQYRDMFNCGNILDRTIISMALDLGWRIGDFLNIKKDMLPNLEGETPLAFDLLTEKEEVISQSFLSGQTVQLLKSYLKTLPKENPYLFGINGGHYKPEAIGKRLKVLSKKSGLHIPRGKRLRFHCFRKRFLSECANLKIDINTAKILVGKSVSKDMLTYLSEVDHRKAFKELHKKLQLTETQSVISSKDAEIEALKKKLAEQDIIIKGIMAYHENQEKERLEKSGKTAIMDETFEDMIQRLGTKAIKEEQEEYAKMIENNNNNH